MTSLMCFRVRSEWKTFEKCQEGGENDSVEYILICVCFQKHLQENVNKTFINVLVWKWCKTWWTAFDDVITCSLDINLETFMV